MSLNVTDESRAKCIQYQEEIHKLQKEIDEYKNNLEIKEKLVNESKNFVSYILLFLTVMKYDFTCSIVIYLFKFCLFSYFSKRNRNLWTGKETRSASQ